MGIEDREAPLTPRERRGDIRREFRDVLSQIRRWRGEPARPAPDFFEGAEGEGGFFLD